MVSLGKTEILPWLFGTGAQRSDALLSGRSRLEAVARPKDESARVNYLLLAAGSFVALRDSHNHSAHFRAASIWVVDAEESFGVSWSSAVLVRNNPAVTPWIEVDECNRDISIVTSQCRYNPSRHCCCKVQANRYRRFSCQDQSRAAESRELNDRTYLATASAKTKRGCCLGSGRKKLSRNRANIGS
jgi:hypothetical protein